MADQVGSTAQPSDWVVSSWPLPPAADTTYSERPASVPVVVRENTSRLPSGDQLGLISLADPLVIRWAALPSARMIQRSPAR